MWHIWDVWIFGSLKEKSNSQKPKAGYLVAKTPPQCLASDATE